MSNSIELVPVGSVIAAATHAPPGDDYLPCHGGVFSKDQYPELFASIGLTYTPGGDKGKGEFQVPDYRGLFLRGVANGTAADPDVAGRIPAGTGQADGIGSKQEYATGRPAIPFRGSVKNLPNNTVGSHGETQGGKARVKGSKTIDTCTSGGDGDTRPVNIYVQYFIKARN